MPSVPHDVYVGFDVLPAELSPTLLTIANGFLVDSKALVFPTWQPDHEPGYYEQVDRTLLLWRGESRLVAEDTQAGVVEIPIKICGVRREDTPTALRDITLYANDVRRVMMGNSQRVDPNNPGASNTWGYGTEEVSVEPFKHLSKAGLPIWIFEGNYIVRVLWPYPKGY